METVKKDPEFKSNDNLRWGLTLVLGMTVLLWRIILPCHAEVTAGIVILAVALDLALAAAVVFLNKKELKEAFSRKFRAKDALKTLLLIIADFAILGIMISFISIDGAPLPELMANAPASVIAAQFQSVFLFGAFISMVIAAPVWEEIVFRLAGKNLLRNGVLFVLVTPLLFAFIHTVNFSLADNLFYICSGVVYAVAYLILKDIRILMLAHFFWNLIGSLGAFFA